MLNWFTYSNRMMRYGLVGPGWVIGSLEALAGATIPGDIVAGEYYYAEQCASQICRLILVCFCAQVTQCRVHYISYKTVEEIETKNALIVLKLYKLLSYLMAKRQEITISHLGTLHAIMSAPARKKPVCRVAQISSFYG
jgi:hypothetical protein